jgi:hypothetical protein
MSLSPVTFPPRAREALDEPDPDRVEHVDEQDGNRRHEALRRHRNARTARYQQPGAALHQRTRNFGLVTDPCDVEHNVSIFDDTDVAQALSKQLNQRSVVSVVRRAERQKTDTERWLLRANVERPSGHRDEPSDELPPSHLRSVNGASGPKAIRMVGQTV